MRDKETAGSSFRRRDYAIALLFSALERGGQTLFLFVGSIVIAGIVGPEAFGVASLALGLVFILENACERLFRDAIVQRQELTDHEIGAAISGAIISSIAIAAAMVASASFVATSFGMPDLHIYLPLASLSIVFAGSGGVLAALLHRRLAFGQLARRTLMGSAVGAPVGILLAVAGFGGLALIAQYVIQTLVSLIALVLSTPNVPRLNLDWRRLVPLVKYALPVTAADSFFVMSFRLFIALVGYFSGALVVGYLEMAARLVNGAKNLWLSVVNPVTLSLLVAHREKTDRFRLTFQRLTAMNTLVALPLFGGMIIIAPDFIALVLGEEWVPAAPAMQFLALAAGLLAIKQFASVAINAVGRPAYNLPVSVTELIAPLAALMLVGAARPGVTALLWCVQPVFSFPIVAAVIWRAARLRPWADLLRPALPALVATAGMFFLASILASWLWADWSLPARLIATVSSSVGIYAVLVLILARRTLADIWSLAAEVRNRRKLIPGNQSG